MAGPTRPDDDTARTPVDRSLDLDQAHLLPPAPDPERGPVVFPAGAPRAIEWTAERLIAGGLVAFPTDTVYALAASLAHAAAIDRIVALKGRPTDKPIPILLASADALDLVALAPDPRLVALAARFWPGPLTVAVAARAGLPPTVVAPDCTVGARVPNHFLAIELIARAGGAVAATSANRGGAPPARDADDVLAALAPDVDLVLDGGSTPGGVPSTVVALAGDDLAVVREGAIPGEVVRAAWRELLAANDDAPPAG